MTVSVTRAVVGGLRRLPTRSGALALGLVLPFNLLRWVQLDRGFVDPWELGVSDAVLLLGTAIGAVAITVLTIRLFCRRMDELSSLSPELLTRRFGRTLVRAVGGALLFTGIVGVYVGGLALANDRVGEAIAVVVALGAIALLVVTVVNVAFVLFAIAVEDDGLVAAVRRSWRLVSGHRWRILVLVLLTGAITSATVPLQSAVAGLDPMARAAILVTVDSVSWLLFQAILSDAYLQLRDGDRLPDSSSPRAIGSVST